MIVSDFYITVLLYMGISIILALGLNAIMGSAGQVHLGSGTYAAVGAYVTGLLVKGLGVSFWLSVPVSVFLGGLVGVISALPLLRVREDFLAIITIGMVFLFETLMIYLPWFGGPVGIENIPRPVLFGAALSNSYLLVLVTVLVIVCSLINRNIISSWIGIAWECIRENEEASSILGINVVRYKIIVFGIGGCYLALGGSLQAIFFGNISPADFSFIPSLTILTMVMVGGIGTIRGSILGAILIVAIPEVFRFVQDYRNLVYGGILVVIMMFQPSGIIGDNSYLWRALRNLRSKCNKVFIGSEKEERI
jgi:branched-chain amino acid transport system permease protein